MFNLNPRKAIKRSFREKKKKKSLGEKFIDQNVKIHNLKVCREFYNVIISCVKDLVTAERVMFDMFPCIALQTTFFIVT